MRDPKRIVVLISLFSIIWSKMPDMRFFQMIDYIKSKLPDESVSMIESRLNGATYYQRDAFNTEDDVVLRTLKEILDELA